MSRPVGHRSPWRSVARGLADLCLPRACAVCRSLMDPEPPPARSASSARVSRPSAVVCGACWSRCESFPAPSCTRCGHPRQPLPGVAGLGERDDGFSRCRWCERLPPTVRAVRSVARVDRGTATAVVHALKYDGWQGVARGMGERMARLHWPDDVIAERTAVVPVPLSATRLRERGFNQSQLLAEEVGRQWALPVWTTLLERVRHTATQTQLTPSERTTNVAEAFRTPSMHQHALRGAHIVLVDDVITTAATLNAAAAALTAGGARLLSYLTFGRAPDSGDRSSLVSDLE